MACSMNIQSADDRALAAPISRRQFVAGAAGALAASALPAPADANVPLPYDWDAAPPLEAKADFIAWMVKNRGEDPGFLGQRWERLQQVRAHRDIWDKRDMRAFVLTPREEFVTKPNIARAYEWHYLKIGSGSGYQSAYLSNLTDKVWSIEIIKPLFERTRRVYDSLIERGYSEYKAITTKNEDGYYGWEQEAPFDEIIVTCGIDHIPPPLLQQLKPNGVMVIPVGRPGAHHVLKVNKQQAVEGTFNIVRSDIYNGSPIPFVPFTKLEGDAIKGTHSGR